MSTDDKKNPTTEEQLANLQTKVDELLAANEAQRVEIENYRNEKGTILKDLKKVKDERESLRQAQMTDEERKASESTRLAELEATLDRERGEALRYKILSTSSHGLDPAFARLVEGTDEASIRASIEAVKTEQAEALKRLAPMASPGTAPAPPTPGGGTHPTLTATDINSMSPAEFAEFERKVKTGQVDLTPQ